MATVKEFLVERGVRRELAVELDEIALAVHSRIVRYKRQGVEKGHILIDIGKYRHQEQKTPKSLPEMLRIALDLVVLALNFNDRFRILEHYDIIKFNLQTAEYELTEFGRQFYAQR